MLNLLQVLRYTVFGANLVPIVLNSGGTDSTYVNASVVFIVCNAVITSVAVWNLSIVQSLSGSAYTTAKQIDSFLIFLGAAGLLLIFPILFFELYGKTLVLGRVWFELLWVGLFWLMQLAGAAALTAQGTSQFCSGFSQGSRLPQPSESPCASTQVLQAFTWIIAILMLGYFTLLSILTIVKHGDDPTILQCSVRRFPVVQTQNPLKNPPASPRFPLSFGAPPTQEQPPQLPPIVAPQPRRHFAALRAAILATRHSGGDDEAGHQRQTSLSSVVTPPTDEDERNRPSSYYPENMVQQNMTTVLQAALAVSPSQPEAAIPPAGIISVEPLRPTRRPTLPSANSTPFYHSAVRMAIDGDKPSATPAVVLPLPSAQMAKDTEPASPPPLGDWPRLDATSRPRVKRKATPEEQAQRQMQPLTRLNMILDRPMDSPAQAPSRPQPQAHAPPVASSSRAYEPQPVPSSSRHPTGGSAPIISWTHSQRKELEPVPPPNVVGQPSASQANYEEQNRPPVQMRKSHERPQRRPSAVLPRPPTLQSRQSSASQAQYQTLYLGAPAEPPRSEARSPAAAVPADPISSTTVAAPVRKESQRRPLPVPQSPPPPEPSLARADSSQRHPLPSPPLQAGVPPPSWRHRPGGPRRQSNDTDSPGLDRLGSYRTSDFDGRR